jgi:hypothetical protein
VRGEPIGPPHADDEAGARALLPMKPILDERARQTLAPQEVQSIRPTDQLLARRYAHGVGPWLPGRRDRFDPADGSSQPERVQRELDGER